MARFTDYRRVIGVAQVLFLAGKWLKRKGIRYTSLAVVVAAGAIAADMALGSVDVSKLKVVLLPGVIAVLTFGVGNTLIGISNLFSSEKLLVADANSMNLMEDRKKCDMDRHLEILWERVFKYESRLCNRDDCREADDIRTNREQLAAFVRTWPGEMKRHFGIDDGCFDEFLQYIEQFRPLSEKMESTREGFIASAGFGLKHTLPQKLQRTMTGFDLSLIEDWYDGAFFTANDNKLKKQFAANRTIRGIRNEIGIPVLTRFKEALSGHPDPLWYSLTMKKVGMSVGRLMSRMNAEYVSKRSPSYFDAQDFLWADAKSDNLIHDNFGENAAAILQELRDSRKKMIRSIFSANKSDACIQIHRMFGRDFANAMDLRLDYDIEFSAGLLDNDPAGDIGELQEMIPCAVFPLKRAKSKVHRAKGVLETADDFLAEYLPDVAAEPLKRRAARTVFHLDKHAVCTLATQDPRRAMEIVERHVKSERKYSRRICLLRQHYELSRIQLFSYMEMVDKLAEFS